MARKQTTEPTARTARPTIATIAAHMGLSRATVTHVLNGRADEQRIRPETQKRVLDVAREMGYRANASARAVRAGRFGNVALVQSLLGQYLPAELLYGLTTAIADKDLHLVMTQVPDPVINDDTYLPHAMRELSADGVLISRHGAFSQDFRERMQQLGIPAVFLNVKQESDCVHPDDLAGGRTAAEYLLGLGHERIAYVEMATPLEHYSQVDRRAGYREAMAAAGRAPWVHALPEDWYAADEPTVDQRLKSARALLARADRPTAVVAYELPEAMAVERAAHLLGLRVPEDLSILVFHNRIESRYSLPFLTVSNVMEEVGSQAIAMLLEKIQAPERSLPERAVPMTVLGGATCLPPSRTS
jgi:DNA-binding LacI/PurR family transcriptional regulator